MAQFDAPFDSGLMAGIRQAARQLKGAGRRNWFAWACRAYVGGSPRAAETIFGWSRNRASFSKAKPVAQASGWHREVVCYHRAATVKLPVLTSRTFDS